MTAIRQRIACRAIISYDSKVLILREASTYADGTNTGRYQFPGGRIEPGERYLDGLHREVLEETGLRVEVGRPLFVGEWRPVIRGEHNQIVAIYFACRAGTDQVVLSDEHDEFRWIEAADYGQYNLLGPEAEALRAYLAAPGAQIRTE